MFMRLPNQDSATGRAIKTGLQSVIGFIVGLAIVIWTVPGVPAAIISYLQDNLIQVLLIVGIPSGLTSGIWNIIRKDIPNY